MVEHHHGKSGMRKMRGSQCFVTGMALFLFGLPFSCFAAGDGPPYFMVEQDWKTLMKNDQSCGSCVRLNRVTVLDMEVRKKTASVQIEVVGDWIGFKDCHHPSGPCAGFSPTGGINQVVSKTVRYKKLDAGWKIVSGSGKSKHGGRHARRKH